MVFTEWSACGRFAKGLLGCFVCVFFYGIYLCISGKERNDLYHICDPFISYDDADRVYIIYICQCAEIIVALR